jgi:hypothetical protein
MKAYFIPTKAANLPLSAKKAFPLTENLAAFLRREYYFEGYTVKKDGQTIGFLSMH